jgi:hypothetical protein
MGYQFFREETYARVRSQPPPKRGKGQGGASAQTGKRSARQIIDEALRAPDATPHVPRPEPPRILVGAGLEEARIELDQVLELARDVKVPNGKGGTRRQRDDTPILLGAVCSYPGRADDDDPLYREWRERSVAWLRETYGDDRLIAIVEHTDEPHGHIHALVHNRGESVKPSHAGHRAAAAVAAAGGTKKAGSDAYKAAERERQDDYHAKVGSKAGLLRIGPGRQRLTRPEYRARAQAAQAEAAAAIEARSFTARARADADAIVDAAKRAGRELLDAVRTKAADAEAQIRAAWERVRDREQRTDQRAVHAEALLDALEPRRQADAIAKATQTLRSHPQAPQGPLDASEGTDGHRQTSRAAPGRR